MLITLNIKYIVFALFSGAFIKNDEHVIPFSSIYVWKIIRSRIPKNIFGIEFIKKKKKWCLMSPCLAFRNKQWTGGKSMWLLASCLMGCSYTPSFIRPSSSAYPRPTTVLTKHCCIVLSSKCCRTSCCSCSFAFVPLCWLTADRVTF